MVREGGKLGRQGRPHPHPDAGSDQSLSCVGGETWLCSGLRSKVQSGRFADGLDVWYEIAVKDYYRL